jgi:hypothetical protein
MHVSESMYPNTTSPRTLAHKQQYDTWEKVLPGLKQAHMEHCLDRLRDYVMCHADLAPSPLYIYHGIAAALGKSGPRVCRKWEPIREWLDSRMRP